LGDKVDAEKNKLKVRAPQSIDVPKELKFESKSIESTAEKGYNANNSGFKQKEDTDVISIDFQLEESLKKRKQKREDEFNPLKKLNSSITVKDKDRDKDLHRYKSFDSKTSFGDINNSGVPVNSNLEKMSLK